MMTTTKYRYVFKDSFSDLIFTKYIDLYISLFGRNNNSVRYLEINVSVVYANIMTVIEPVLLTGQHRWLQVFIDRGYVKIIPATSSDPIRVAFLKDI